MIKLLARIYEAACVAVCSVAVGGGIGFLEGCVVFRREGASMWTLAAFAALQGMLVSLLVGPFAYYVLIRGLVSFIRFANIVLVCLVVGMATAFAFGPAGWLAWIVTPVAALGASLLPVPFAPREPREAERSRESRERAEKPRSREAKPRGRSREGQPDVSPWRLITGV